MKRAVILTILITSIVLVSGCAEKETADTAAYSEDATQACVTACMRSIADGVSHSNGPCLSDEIWKDWVCDIAHSPREEVDNDPANQCPAYREGKAHHFVEVDADCVLIRTY